MKLVITDDRNEVDRNAMGGTELMGAGLQKYVPADLLSQFNIIRSRVRYVDPDRPNILWLHDLPEDPESQHLKDPKSLERFSKIVYVSNWQKEMYQLKLGIPASKGTVIKNAIDPIPEELIDKDSDEIRLIYHPTPHRGLDILVPVFERLCEEFDNIVLDVFSSFKIYGWEERDQYHAATIQRCKDHPKINYHGSQPQEIVRAALGRAHIFAYPSIWMETSCICAMEAMSAKCLMVLPNYAALPETTAGYALEYDWTDDVNDHAMRFYRDLRNAIVAVQHERFFGQTGMSAHLSNQKAYADNFYCWESRKLQWRGFLHNQLVDRNQVNA